MNSRIRLGYPGFGLVFCVIGVALGACSTSDDELSGAAPCADSDPECKVGGAGGGTDPPPGGTGGEPTHTGLAGAGGDGNGYFDSTEAGGGGIEIPAGCMGVEQSPRIFYMSADDSNSMGSPAHARELIHIGFEPNPYRIRTYEFLNYYRIAYTAPEYGKLELYPELETKTDDPAVAEFQLGVRSFDALVPRRPMNLVFLIDTSGSMKGPGMDRAKAAVKAIASMLVAGDTVSIIASDTTLDKLDGHSVTGPNDPMLLSHLDTLKTGGKADLYTALGDAYTLAKKYDNESLMSRVILISDGGVNAGVTSTDLIKDKSADADKEGIYLIGVGTGPALSYDDQLMNDVTDAGRGAYVYLDSVEEATRIFTERFDETMDVAARNVQVEVTLPWYFKVKGISTEEISEKPVTAQHLAPNDAMVFNLEITACDPSVYDLEDNVRIRAFWKTRVGNLDQVTEANVPLKSLKSSIAPALPKGRAIVAFAEALKGCESNTQSNGPCVTEADRKQITKEKLALARNLSVAANPSGNDPELNEIISLIDNHPLLVTGL